MRAFITGINGFAGEHLARHLLAAGDEVAGCTRFGESEGVSPEVKFQLPWDMGQRSFAGTARQQFLDFAPQWIFHLAALSFPSQCGKHDPTPEALRSNVEGTQELLECMQELPGTPRLIFISSSHVYGSVTAEKPYCTEDQPCEPASAYGKTKWMAEQVVDAAVRSGKVEAVVARAFHHTGPGQLPPGMVPSWTKQLLDPEEPAVKVFTLAAHLNVSDVRDVVAAYRLLAEGGHNGEAYNIGSERGYFGHEIMQQLMDVAGINKPVEEESKTGRQNPLAQCDKIFAHVGWRAERSLTQTLEDTVAYWREKLRRNE